MLKVAWFSPLPPERTGVAEYCQDLLPHLAEHLELDLFVEDPALHAGTPLAADFPLLDYRDFPRLGRSRRYDVAFYQMGNSIAHRFVFLTLCENPGVVTLHEPMLHHLMLEMLTKGWTMEDYRRELDYNYGVRREEIESIVAADGTELSRFRYPMIQRVVDCSLGMVTLSEYARDVVARHNPPGPVRRINHAYVPEPEAEGLTTLKARRSLGIDPDAFCVGTFGFITPSKRIESILEAFARFAREAPDARLLLAGGTVPEYPVVELVAAAGLEDRVLLTGYVPWGELLAYMVACDVALSLRWPSAGETPGGLIRLLGLGRPVIAHDHTAFAEFPDGVCLKVGLEREPEEILRRLRQAYSDRDGMAEMGRRAKEYVATEYRVEDSAAEYASFVERVVAGGPAVMARGGTVAGLARDELIDEVTDELAGMGVGRSHSRLLRELSAAIDDVMPHERDL